MAGTITASETTIGSVRQIVFSWLTDGSGDATATATGKEYSGDLIKVLYVPGTTTPSNLYDITLTDGDSYDLLAGQGTDCPNGSTLVITGGLLPVATSAISLTVANGGAIKTGKVVIYLR